MKTRMWSALFLMFAVSSCRDAGSFAGGGGNRTGADNASNPKSYTDQFQLSSSAATGKADILLFLDTSDSMHDELLALQNNLQGFADRVAQGDQGIDYQLIVYGNASKLQLQIRDAHKLDIVNTDVNSHSGLWDAYQVLEGNVDKVPASQLKLRSDALKELVFVTDDNATGIDASNFGPWAKKNKAKFGEVHVNGFVGVPGSRICPTCHPVAIGSEYMTLAQDATFSGLVDDVCTDNWLLMLQRLAEQIRARSGKSNVFTLKYHPINSNIKVTVDQQSVATDAWTYHEPSNQITLDLTKVTRASGQVAVTYDARY